jgi:predicted ABC-type ATPase
MDTYEYLTKGVRKSKNKFIFFFAGAAGSGKTTGRERFLKDLKINTSYVYLNPDSLKALGMPYDVPTLVDQLTTDGYSVVIDVTSRNKKSTLSLIHDSKKKGYKIYFAIVYASLPTVLDRVSKRLNQPMPEEAVRDVYQHLTKNVEVYMKTRDIDKLYLYSNEETYKLIFHRDFKKIHCLSPEEEFYFDVSQYC